MDQSPDEVSAVAGYKKKSLEERAEVFNFGAPVTGATAIKDAIAVCFGDGSVRFFRPEEAYTEVQAHDGVVLCLAADIDHLLTGGDDGRFLRTGPDCSIVELSNFGSKWVDCVAASNGLWACSSGRNAFIWTPERQDPVELEHSSTVGGLAFDVNGKRLAVSHYGGVTVWEQKKHRWRKSKLFWQGSHGSVTFSPDGKFIVTAMQENALHGWRLRGKIDLAMTGYPAKSKSFAWVGDVPYLATSGGYEAICWPFDGPQGPMERPPVCVAQHGENIATSVEAFPYLNAVFAGFQDGAVLVSQLDEDKDVMALRGPTGIEVTAIAVNQAQSHLIVGDAKGQVLWAPLNAERSS